MQLSKHHISPKMWQQWWRVVVKTLHKQSDQDITTLLDICLAKDEKIMLAKRMIIAHLVVSGWSSYAIAKEMKVSVSTVYKYHRIINENQQSRELLKRIFPKKLSPQTKSPQREGTLSQVVTAILEGRTNRSKLYQLGER